MAGELADDTVLDGALDVIATATSVYACSQAPTTYTEASSTYALGTYTLTAGDGNGDWVIANGDSSGRKITLQAQSGNNGTGTGACTHLAFTVSTTLLFVTAASGDTINSGSPWTIGAYDVVEFSDPA